MIAQIFLTLRDELANFIAAKEAAITVVVDKIPLYNALDDALENTVIISLFNIEEDKRLKDMLPGGGQFVGRSGTVALDLFTLITCHFPSNYLLGLQAIALVMQFFHQHPFFTLPEENNDPDEDANEAVHFAAEFFSLQASEVLQLWAAYHQPIPPFALYKITGRKAI